MINLCRQNIFQCFEIVKKIYSVQKEVRYFVETLLTGLLGDYQSTESLKKINEPSFCLLSAIAADCDELERFVEVTR
jgi:hypothetical protein